LVCCPFLLFLGTLFEEDLPQHLLLLLVGVIVLHIVVAGLVEHEIVIVVAVRVLVPDPTSLSHALRTRGCSIASCQCSGGASIGHSRGSDVGGEEQHSLVETTDHWDLERLLFILLFLLLIIILDKVLFGILLGSVAVGHVLLLQLVNGLHGVLL
jgi:hypothetical protein